MVNEIIERMKEKMSKSVDYFRDELKSIRTGRASVSLFENIKINYYGTQTLLNQLATLHTPDPHTISIQPWDPSVIKDIEKAILSSNLGFNPSNDGKLIRIPVPPLTEERRKELTKAVKKMAEDTKIAVRNERRAGLEEMKKVEKSGEISEDESKKGSEKLQAVTDEFIQKIDKLVEKKIEEIMEI
jgi:ribosome recycling factor